MKSEKKNQITRDLMMGLVFDPANLIGERFFTKLHVIARRAGIDDGDFDRWYKELLRDYNRNLLVVPMRVASGAEEDVEICWTESER